MALELISHALCPYVQRTSALLTDLEVPFTPRFIDLKAKPDWFLAISPRGKVPVLVVDGTPIFESAVILEYVAERHAPWLVPTDPLERARQRMWIELTSDLLAGQYKIMTARTRSERATAVTSSYEALARFEPLLGAKYFGGARMGLVDYAAAPAFARFALLDRQLGLDLYEGLPKVTTWARALASHPSVQATLVPDFERQFEALITHPAAA